MTFHNKAVAFFLTSILVLAISSCEKPIPTATSTKEDETSYFKNFSFIAEVSIMKLFFKPKEVLVQ